MSEAFKPLLARLADGATLDEEAAEAFFAACLRGEPTPAQIAAAVTAMRMRGETVGELTACAGVGSPRRQAAKKASAASSSSVAPSARRASRGLKASLI